MELSISKTRSLTISKESFLNQGWEDGWVVKGWVVDLIETQPLMPPHKQTHIQCLLINFGN